jgi:hypothetical protein
MDALVEEMAKAYMNDKKIELEAAKAELKEKLSAAESKMHGATVSYDYLNFRRAFHDFLLK